MKKNSLLTLGLALIVGATLTACGNKDKGDQAGGKDTDKHSVALVTDLGGIDDRSFNQSAWEGLQEWGKTNNRERGAGGFQYYASNSDADFIPNLNQAVNDGFSMVVGVGFKLKPAIEEVAEMNKDTDFVLIDEEIKDKDNVVSVLFKDNEAAYLAGVAAAKTTKTNKVGFIGGVQSAVIDRFQAGFEAGVHSVNPDIKVNVQYAGSFGDASKGNAIASAMYQQGVDIIFHASGDTGNGVFTAAIDQMKKNPENPVWVIGVDRDQEEQGKIDDKRNVTLTSTLKGVGEVVKDIATRAEKGKFPAGELIVYGLAEGGVDLTDGQLSEEALKAIEEVRQQIISGDIKVPTQPK